MSSEFNESNYSSKMDKSIISLKKDISTLRTGRANTNMLDTIKVDVYGQLMPIEQLATVSVPEARLISIQVWDKSNLALIESSCSQRDHSGKETQPDRLISFIQSAVAGGRARGIHGASARRLCRQSCTGLRQRK